MKSRRLGKNGPTVSAIGLGCYGMSGAYGRYDDRESLAALDRAIELGITLINTSDAYGAGHNEELVGRAIKGRRDRVVLNTKFGNPARDAQGRSLGISGRPEYVPQACAASLRRLGVDHIDLYILHRVDPTVPIEDTVGAMARLVEEGKVRYIGLSEAASQTVRRGQAVYPLAALETEYSLWSREPEAEMLPTCRELGIGFVAYSPLGRGFLTGAVKRTDGFLPNDPRLDMPRFKAENLPHNLTLVERLKSLADEKGCTMSQVVLAWLLSRGEDIVPIPGTKRVDHLEENIGALEVALTEKDIYRIEQILPLGAPAGKRYSEDYLPCVNL